MEWVLRVPDMNCSHCERRIRQALAGAGYAEISVDLANKLVRIRGEPSVEQAMEALRQVGYTPEPV